MYNIKELEKSIPKKCQGVAPMLVKELVQQMIDEDGVISVEKCGNINVYWCFKNQITMSLYKEIKNLQSCIEKSHKDIQDMKIELQLQKSGPRAETFDRGREAASRSEYLLKNEELDCQVKSLSGSYERLSQNKWDQDKINAKISEISKGVQQLDLVGDNIDILTDYLRKKYVVGMKELRQELGMPDEFKEFEDVSKFLT